MNYSDAMKDFLSRWDWKIWFTITCEDERYTEYMKKRFKRYVKHLNKTFQFYDKYVHCFTFYERNRGRKGVHIHAVIDRIDPVCAFILHEQCNQVFGYCKVEPFRIDVLDYVAKKYNKPWLEDFDFYKINSRYRIKSVHQKN